MHAPYDFIAHEHGPRSFTAVADRDRLAHRGIFASGAWHLSADGGRLAAGIKNHDVADFVAHIQNRGDGSGTGGNRDRATVLEPAGIARRRSTTAAKLSVTTVARTTAFSPRSVTKDEATRPTSTSFLGLESHASATCAETHSVASGDSRSDFSPKAVMSLASDMNHSRNSASNPGSAPASLAGQRTTASLPGTRPRPCPDVGTPWPESPDGPKRENGWRSPATNAIHGTVTVPASPKPSSRAPTGPCNRGTCRAAC